MVAATKTSVCGRNGHLSVILALLLLSLCSHVDGLRALPMRMASSAPKADRNELSKPKREFRTLRGMPCTGTYSTPNGKKYTSAFLGLQRMETEKRVVNGVEEIIVFNVVPVPIRPDLEAGILAATGQQAPSLSSNHWSKGVITDRDGGFFDSLLTLPFFVHGPDNINPHAKKKVYDFVHKQSPGVPQFPSPYHAMLEALDSVAKLRVTGLLIEVADRPSKDSISVGGAVLVVPSSMEEEQRTRDREERMESGSEFLPSRSHPVREEQQSWTLTAKNSKIIRDVQHSKDANFIKCHTDELIGFAFALNIPVLMSATVFDTLSVSGLLTKDSSGTLTVTAPHFASKEEETMWAGTTADETPRQQQKPSEKKKNVLIDDASTFLTMTTAEKREWVRNCDLHPSKFPRPREGPRALDAVMLPLLDIELTYEILRRLAEKKGNHEEAAQMTDFQSEKPHLARAISIARAMNDDSKVRQLCNELDSLSHLPYDPLDPNNGEGPWDVEHWYYEARKKMYNIAA